MHTFLSRIVFFERWRYLSSVATAFFLLTGSAYADAWLDVEPALLAYDNLTRAQGPEDRRSDRAVSVQVSAGRMIAWSGFDRMDLAVAARSEAYDRYHGLDVLALEASVGYRHKFGVGRDRPWIAAELHATHEDYRDDTRDGNRLDIDVEIGRRISERLDAALGLMLDRRYAKYDAEPEVPGYSARVFDLQGHGIYARVGCAISERLFMNAQVMARRGDVESTAQPGYAIYVASDAIADDPAFNDPNLYAYRLRATTYTTTLTASWALSDNASVNLQYVDNRARAAYALAYTDRALALSLALRYP